MKIGVRGHDLGVQDNISELGFKIKQIGFDFIQLVLKKVIKNVELNERSVDHIKNEFTKNNVEIAMLGAYFNPVHSNKEKVKFEILEFKEYLKFANLFGCKYVGTETGSYNDDSWTYHPKNHTEDAFKEVAVVVKELVNEAEKYHSYVAIEPAYNHVIYNSALLKKLIEEIDSDHLVVTIDLYNLLNINNYHNHREIFDEYLNLFKDKIKLIHFKDFIVEGNELIRVGLGEGVMDFRYIIKKINEMIPESITIFEGVPEGKLNDSLKYIKKIELS